MNRLYTFKISNKTYSYNTVLEMRSSINDFNNKGINVDNNSIKIVKAPKTLNKLINIISNEIDNKEDLNDNIFVELVSSDIINIVELYSNNVALSKKDYYSLIDTYEIYNYCTDIQEVKLNLVIDTIQSNLEGNKTNYTNFKKKQLKRS